LPDHPHLQFWTGRLISRLRVELQLPRLPLRSDFVPRRGPKKNVPQIALHLGRCGLAVIKAARLLSFESAYNEQMTPALAN
jgi:hypothetical protein